MTKKVGIIGYGSMGSMLLHGLFNKSNPEQLSFYVSTRMSENIEDLKKVGINVCLTNNELVRECDIIFMCIKPMDFRALLNEIYQDLTMEKHLISIAGSLSIANIEKIHKGKISRVLPTFISTVNEGVTLVCYNTCVLDDDRTNLEALLNSISTVKIIPEHEFELASDLTSCAPGLFAEIFKVYVSTAGKHTHIPVDEIRQLVVKTIIGTAKLLDVNYGFDDIIKHVATKGGATEAGVQVLDEKLPEIFHEMFEETLIRQRDRMIKIDEQFKR